MFILKTFPKVGHTEIKFNANVLFFAYVVQMGTFDGAAQGLANRLN